MSKDSKSRKLRLAAPQPSGRAAPVRQAPAVSGAWLDSVRRVVLPALVLVVITVAAFAPVVNATGFLWDDDHYVTANPYLKDAAGLFALWFRPGSTTMYAPLYAPAVFTTFWVEYQLWGLNLLGYHLVNLAFHVGCSLLLWRVLRRLDVRGAWLAAALFGVHPVMVESVAWVVELKNVQSAFFCLLALLAYMRFNPLDGMAPPDVRTRLASYVLALLLFAVALLTKPVVVALPPAMLILIWWKRGRLEKVDVLRVAPLLAMGLAAALLAVYIEHYYGGATGAAWQLSLLERILVAGRAVWFYAAKLAWPANLLSVYPRWQVSATTWWQYLFPVGAAALVGTLWHWRGRFGRGPLAAVLCFGVLVSPLVGIFNVAYHLYSFVADHFQYHAAPALFALVAAALTSLRHRFRGRPFASGVNVICGALLVVLGTMSWQHTQTFSSERARCLHTLERNPDAWLAMNNLGVALAAGGEYPEAISQYRQALRVRPIYAEAHNNLGVALVAVGEYAEAVTHYREALRIWPNYAAAHNNLGAALAAQGRVDDAVGEYRAALRLEPDYAEAHNNLGTALVGLGRVDEAIAHYRQALHARTDYAEAANNLGLALASLGSLEEAIEHYRKALQIAPDYAEAHNNLGIALASRGDGQEAIREYREALRIKLDYPQALYNLGTALAARGEVAEAIDQYRAALRLKADYVEAHNNLGTALVASGHVEEAIAHYREALRIKPDYAEAHNNLGTALASEGKLAEAFARYQDAMRLRPDYAEAHHNLGLLLASAGRSAEALPHFQEALRIKSDYVDAYNSLGVTLASLGRLDEAVRQFERALQLDPANQAARRNLERARALAR